MKRLATLLLAAGLVFGASQAAQAIEFKGSGIFQAYFGWSNASSANSFDDPKSAASDRFRPAQRLRLKLEMIANENLRGVFHIENNILWGQEASGGELSGDGVNVAVKQAYLDWVIPSTDVQVRIGLQPFALPSMVVGSAVLDEDMTGIVISKTFNENVAATLFWTRLYGDNIMRNDNPTSPDTAGDDWHLAGHDAADFFGLVVPLSFDGFNVTPWAMYGQTGKNMGGWNNDGNNYYAKHTRLDESESFATGKLANLPDADIWYAGITAELIAFDPFRFAIDFNYGSADTDARAYNDIASQNAGDWTALETSGYYVSAIAEYKLDMMTPGILGWYASGNDEDAKKDGGGMMPAINAYWKGTSFGFADYFGSGNGSVEVFGDSPVGTAGVALQAKDITFMEDLSHLFRVAYYVGTNDHRGLDVTGQRTYRYANNNMSGADSALEFNLNTRYNIYENLVFSLELAYISMDWEEKIWGNDMVDNAYRVNAAFGYSF